VRASFGDQDQGAGTEPPASDRWLVREDSALGEEKTGGNALARPPGGPNISAKQTTVQANIPWGPIISSPTGVKRGDGKYWGSTYITPESHRKPTST
jgi:hypothetical protein